MKSKILLDIDGVIADFFRGFASHLNDKQNAGIDLSKEPPVYSLHNWGHDIPRDVVDAEIIHWMESGGYEHMPMYEGAKEFVYKLMDKYDVHIVTARVGDFRMNLPEAIQAIIRRDTERWFQNHGIPADKLFFEHKKVDFCKENNIPVLIEDKLSTVVEAAESGMPAILIDRGWNQEGDAWYGEHLDRNHSNIYVAYNYNDVLDILGDLVE